ncbi:MAG: hypothetical protein ACI9M1_002083 [Porticoccaceae bacterium]|jgi:hypothetical protein
MFYFFPKTRHKKLDIKKWIDYYNLFEFKSRLELVLYLTDLKNLK